jgi:hypothetical protein
LKEGLAPAMYAFDGRSVALHFVAWPARAVLGFLLALRLARGAFP